MDEDERRSVLEAIARDESAYPRDRIAAVKTINEMDREAGRALDAELEALIATK
jgi:hypothetical protein